MALNLNGTKYTEKELQTLAKAGVLHIGRKNDPASTTLTAPALHGPFQGNAAQYGLFSYPGVRPERYSALQRPRSMARILRPMASEYTEEILEIATGQTASSGTNPAGFCGNPVTVGQLKTCQQVHKFGSYIIKTDLNAVPLIGQLRNRADVPAEILNAGPAENPLIPDIMFNLRDTRDVLAYELFRIGVDLERQMEQVLIRGQYTGSTQQNFVGFFQEFNGLDQLIKTGYTDAVTGAVCAAADSAIISFNAAVSSTMGGGDGRNIVQAASDLYWALRDRATSVGMEGVDWAIVMRKEQFRAVVEQWACNYATYRCTSGTVGNPFNTDTGDTNALRLEMMNGQYLLHDGIAVPVVFSEGISSPAIANATYEADMYYVPLSWNGAPLLRLEYFDMGNQYATAYRTFVDSDDITVINNGMFIVGVRSTGLCKEYHFASRMRMILETPFLAGRIDNINYTFRAPSREAIPGTSLYVDGGTTYRS